MAVFIHGRSAMEASLVIFTDTTTKLNANNTLGFQLYV